MKIKFTVVWLLSFAAVCFAQGNKAPSPSQTKPDLNGTWALDFSRSRLGPSKRDLAYDELTLTISQREPELKVTREWVKHKKAHSEELVFYTDGRGEENPVFATQSRVASKTRWEGTVLVSKGMQRNVIGSKRVLLETIDTWQVSSDGQTLIYKTGWPPRTDQRTIILGDIEPLKRVFRRLR